MMKDKKELTIGQKIGKWVGICVGGLAALLAVIILALHLFTPLVFHDFFGNAHKEYRIPGLGDGLVPQGHAYVAEKEVYLQCGYMADGVSASRIYVTDAKDTGNPRFVELYASDGTPYTGHTGGITAAGGFVWLANDGEGEDNCMWVMSLNEILATENGGKITLTTKFQSETRAACCFADDKYLWVGEFNDGEKYVTDPSHKFTVSSGENAALVCAYPLDATSVYGIAFTEADGQALFTPAMALSVTDRVQGFTKTPDGFALSTSYGLGLSHIYFHKDVTAGEADASMTVNGATVPMYFLDSESLTDDIPLPPMSEEIFIKDGRLYVLLESACKKYIFGNLIRGRHVYSYGLE
jgi:hypothetical protein